MLILEIEGKHTEKELNTKLKHIFGVPSAMIMEISIIKTKFDKVSTTFSLEIRGLKNSRKINHKIVYETTKKYILIAMNQYFDFLQIKSVIIEGDTMIEQSLPLKMVDKLDERYPKIKDRINMFVKTSKAEKEFMNRNKDMFNKFLNDNDFEAGFVLFWNSI